MRAMANSIAKEHRLLWTLLVRGADTLTLAVPSGPPLEHAGGETVWKVLMTPMEIAVLEKFIQAQGLSVEKMHEGRGEIRSREEEVPMAVDLSQVDPNQLVYRTKGCPDCFFFHPEGSQCGVEDWPPEMLSKAMEMPKASEDHQKCEVHGQ